MSRIFGDVRQNGYVVRDIGSALEHWTEVLGVGPFWYFEEAPVEDFRYGGEPSDVVVSIALASEPADGSVSPNAAILVPLASCGRYFCFCSSVPNKIIG